MSDKNYGIEYHLSCCAKGSRIQLIKNNLSVRVSFPNFKKSSKRLQIKDYNGTMYNQFQKVYLLRMFIMEAYIKLFTKEGACNYHCDCVSRRHLGGYNYSSK